jgi:phosphatidylinositol-3-phosphatase
MRRGSVVVWLGALAMAFGLLIPSMASAYTPPPVKHVFVIIDENESASVTFGADSPAPYLSKTLVSQGAYLPNYHGVGHASLDNYIAMVSGQAPNTMTTADCSVFANFPAGDGIDATTGQHEGAGCVYPTDVPTLMSQLGGAGLTWRAYEDGMGGMGAGNAADEARDNTTGTPPTCGHPAVGSVDGTQSATATDQYATRHDPFVNFHSVIDNAAQCDADVVNLSELPTDLKSAATTPNYVFITPDLCDDGHNTPCNDGVGPGGLAQADSFLQTWVPQITASPAFKENGLLIITFDEAADSDTSACCGELPGPQDPTPGGTGPGGGDTGAVLLSPYIKAGTTSSVPYNHYSMLGSVEDIFGLPRIGYAAGTTAFGPDVYTNAAPPEDSALKLTPSAFTPHHGTRITYRDSAAAVTTLVFAQLTRGYIAKHGCTALGKRRKRPKHTIACTLGKTIATKTHADTAGLNTIRFTGRLHGHALTAGSYRLTATPALSGLTGTPRSAPFKVK